MYAVILAGGSGTRLWPLSRELYPKQFLPQPGEGERSLFAGTLDRLPPEVTAHRLIVVTHRDQAGEIRRRLNAGGLEEARVLAEPEARNTAPAIGLAAWLILGEAGPGAVMAVLPSDHLIADEEAFAALLRTGAAAAESHGLVTFGIRPSYAETGYGYILSGAAQGDGVHEVEKFVEKPDEATAREYLHHGRYLWNSGMFVFQAGALAAAYRRFLPGTAAALDAIDFLDPDSLVSHYPRMERTSIDYGILEKAEKVSVIPTQLPWSDLGSWEAYHQAAPRDETGNYTRGRVLQAACRDSLILAESRLVGAVGLEDVVVVETADAVLVCNRQSSQEVRTVVDALRAADDVEAREHRTVYRPWGSYTSLETGPGYQVKRIDVNAGARLSLQSHNHRAENWIVISGEALVTRNDELLTVGRGESVFIPQGARHRLENRGPAPLSIIEVQNGDYLGEDDIVRYEDDYGRDAGGASGSAPGSAAPDSGSSSAPGSASGSAPGSAASPPPAGPPPGSSAASPPAVPPTLPAPPRGYLAPPADDPRLTLARQHHAAWQARAASDPDLARELALLGDDPAALLSHFSSELVFGTGGMRGLMGPGLNRLNKYTVRRATQGLAHYLKARGSGQAVAIAFDTRHRSAEFAREAALVLAGNGIRALLFDGVRPTPLLSYVTRELNCAAGIVITASHNPPAYNGYKIYGPDGGQAVSPLVDEVAAAIAGVDIFSGVRILDEEAARTSGLLQILGPEQDKNYLAAVRGLSLASPSSRVRVVYTPLHGTGAALIPALLEEMPCVELLTVPDQSEPDPDFSTVKSPNPEDPAALEAALQLAREAGADLVLATDPDADRVGTAARDEEGQWHLFDGNQVGALLLAYLCERHRARATMPPAPALVKTIVTGDLGRRVAETYGLEVVETLTGFKFIGEQIEAFTRRGRPDFLFGYEESCGYLTGAFVRDKDAVIASALICEMAAYYRDGGRSLPAVLEALQAEHGYFRESLLTVELEDMAEAESYLAAYANLPPSLAGLAVTKREDYGKGEGLRFPGEEHYALKLPRSPVLRCILEDGSWFAVRPSGTEPKIKFYLSATGRTPREATEKLAALKTALQTMD